MAVSSRKVIHYEFTNENINKKVFKNFFQKTIEKLGANGKENSLIIMDNHVTHLTNEILNYAQKEKIKILYSVPYESSFNCIELAFRHLKNITYKEIAPNITAIKNKLISIIDSKDFEEILYKNYLEALGTYINYYTKNKEVNLNE